MRKAIQLRVLLWIEGEDEPAHDFAARTMRAVRDMVSRGSTQDPELRMTIRRMTEADEE